MKESMVKIRLKIGQVEVEYEGDFSLLKDSSNLIEVVSEFYEKHIATLPNHISLDHSKDIDPLKVDREFDFSINTIAGHLNAKDGKDLVMATATYLTFIEKKDVFARKEILDKMKEAPSYYKDSMSKNLTNSLKSLMEKNCLNQNKKGFYCLSQKEKEDMKTKLSKL